MYWKTDTIDIPHWSRQSLLAQLEVFDSEGQQPLSAEAVDYCRYYGLDLWMEHPFLFEFNLETVTL